MIHIHTSVDRATDMVLITVKDDHDELASVTVDRSASFAEIVDALQGAACAHDLISTSFGGP